MKLELKDDKQLREVMDLYVGTIRHYQMFRSVVFLWATFCSDFKIQTQIAVISLGFDIHMLYCVVKVYVFKQSTNSVVSHQQPLIPTAIQASLVISGSWWAFHAYHEGISL
jgi:hypothetical protein